MNKKKGNIILDKNQIIYIMDLIKCHIIDGISYLEKSNELKNENKYVDIKDKEEYIQMIKNRIYLLEKFCNEYDRYAKTQFEKTYKLDKPNSSNYRLSIENFKLDLFKYQI